VEVTLPKHQKAVGTANPTRRCGSSRPRSEQPETGDSFTLEARVCVSRDHTETTRGKHSAPCTALANGLVERNRLGYGHPPAAHDVSDHRADRRGRHARPIAERTRIVLSVNVLHVANPDERESA
jgi:hypothetical protein